MTAAVVERVSNLLGRHPLIVFPRTRHCVILLIPMTILLIPMRSNARAKTSRISQYFFQICAYFSRLIKLRASVRF
jgi:hypothetical protein